MPCRVQQRGLIPPDLTLNSAESCLGLCRVQEEREAFLGKEMPPKQPPHKPGTCRKILHRSLAFKGLKNDCSFLWQLQREPEEVTFEEILFTAAPEPCVSWAELRALFPALALTPPGPRKQWRGYLATAGENKSLGAFPWRIPADENPTWLHILCLLSGARQELRFG